MSNIDFKNKRVFISGGSGVIGKYLVKKLHAQGAEIFVGDLQLKPSEWPKEIHYRQGDLNTLTKDEVGLFAPEYFFHLAATFERSVESHEFWADNFHHNLKLSNHLISTMKDLPSLKKVIFASSYLIYEPDLYHFQDYPSSPTSLSENNHIYPRNLIGCAKLQHEIELRFLHQFNDIHFKSVSARIYRSYGRGSRDVISRWVRSAIKGEEISVYQPENQFDFIYADDVAEGLIRLASTPKAEGIINLGKGRARSIQELVGILKQHFPDLVIKHDKTSSSSYEASQADMRKFNQIAGWSPSQDLEDTIPQIISYEKKSLQNIIPVPPNILVTSISNKTPLIHAVKNALDKATTSLGKLYGGDSNSKCTGRYFVDHFWSMPKDGSLSTKDLISYCTKHKISIIVPTRDAELEYFASISEKLKKEGIRVMISDSQSIVTCNDKFAFYQHSQKSKLPVIPTYLTTDNVSCDKLVVKEQGGAGSRILGLNQSKKQVLSMAIEMKSPIFQPYIEGEEISIDIYVDQTGHTKGIIMRKRDMVVSGESQITTTYINPQLEKMVHKFTNSLKLYGHVMLQVIIDVSGRFHIIECNPRFGGASTLSISAGLDSFYWFILESMGVDLDDYPFTKLDRETRQIRFKSDLVISL